MLKNIKRPNCGKIQITKYLSVYTCQNTQSGWMTNIPSLLYLLHELSDI